MSVSNSDQALLRRMQDSLVEALASSRTVVNVPGFVALFHADNDMVWINQSVPVEGLTETSVEQLIAAFQQRERSPWLEFFVELWPEVPARLEEAGLVCHKCMPVMVLQAENWKGHEPRVAASIAGPDQALELATVTQVAFGGEAPSEKAVDRTRKSLENGTELGAIAQLDGQTVGGGFAVGSGPIREIAGIGTHASYRRQGVASAVIACLLNRFFGDNGEVAWLTPGDDGAEGVYTKLGFRTISEQVCYGLPGTKF